MKKLYTLVLGLALALMWMASAGSTVAHAEPETLPTVSDRSYAEYLGMYGDQGFHGASISLKASAAVADDGQLMQLEGREALVLGDQGYAQWRFPVEKAGLYRLEFDYYSIQGTGGDIERAVYLDGQLPFQESYNINLSRVFRDENPVVINQHGDDFRPRQEEVHLWQKRAARDQFGYFGEALYYYLSEGEHTLELAALREPVAVHELTLVSQEVTLPTYQEYLAQKTAQGAQPVQGALEDGILVLQAESPYRKSHQSLFAVNDNSSPMTAPYDPAYKRLNAIGGLRWNRVGQWISWQVDVPQDGLYHIGARSKQNVYRDLVSVRSLYIDGEAPFQEALGIEFAFSDNFNVQPFHAGGQPFLVYLTKGVHEITLATSLGSIADILMASSHNLAELNRINLQLIALMGTTPDIDRDYQISTFMPELLEWMERVRQGLTAVRADLLQAVSYSDAMIAQLDLLLFQMERMVKYPDRMAEYFGGFRELIRSFGSWIMQAREKPLLLDYVFISEPGAALPPAEHGFLKNFWYGARAFAASFYTDYTSLSGSDQAGKEKDFITVWIGDGLVGGRDQAVALNRMIKDEFTAITGIPVNLQLVPGGTILTATLAGKGPDIALQLDGTAPVNYAMRNALYDLSSFPDYEEVFSRFPAPAVTPFEYRGGVYAIPETYSFPMLFYRTDIMRDLGVDVDQLRTWGDVISLLPTLQRQNMSFGLYPDIGSYLMFLYQRGGSLYNEDYSASALDTRTAIDAFTYWMDFYVNYALEKDFNFADRFRSGEMPIGVADYSAYNLLYVSAPEIRGQWTMVPVPGTPDAGGRVNNIAPGGGAGAVIMRASRHVDAAWTFLKWWTSADVQYRYGMELEAVMGVGARYNTANKAAFERLPWMFKDRHNLQAQMDNTMGTPQIPGGYYTTRYLDFAKIAVYSRQRNPKDALLDYIDDINGEIRQKRTEFNLD